MTAVSIKDVLSELVKSLREEGRSYLQNHFKDVLGISPEVARLDVITLEATIASSTSITQPGPVRVHSDMDFEVFGIGGYISNPSDSSANFGLITVNVKEVGRNFDMFTSNLAMAQLLTTGAAYGPVMLDRGLYKFSKGSDIKATFYCASGWAGGTKTCGITLWGNLIRSR